MAIELLNLRKYESDCWINVKSMIMEHRFHKQTTKNKIFIKRHKILLD